MANKFLGEAGLGVLTEEIKKRTYVGQKLDELHSAFSGKISNPNDITINGKRVDMIIDIFKNSILMTALLEEYPDLHDHVTSYSVVYDTLCQFLQKPYESTGYTFDYLIRSSAMIENYVFSIYPSGSGSTNIQEITAQEVTDKFNS